MVIATAGEVDLSRRIADGRDEARAECAGAVEQGRCAHRDSRVGPVRVRLHADPVGRGHSANGQAPALLGLRAVSIWFPTQLSVMAYIEQRGLSAAGTSSGRGYLQNCAATEDVDHHPEREPHDNRPKGFREGS